MASKGNKKYAWWLACNAFSSSSDIRLTSEVLLSEQSATTHKHLKERTRRQNLHRGAFLSYLNPCCSSTAVLALGFILVARIEAHCILRCSYSAALACDSTLLAGAEALRNLRCSSSAVHACASIVLCWQGLKLIALCDAHIISQCRPGRSESSRNLRCSYSAMPTSGSILPERIGARCSLRCSYSAMQTIPPMLTARSEADTASQSCCQDCTQDLEAKHVTAKSTQEAKC